MPALAIVDCGAESGRVMLVQTDRSTTAATPTQEVHRFQTKLLANNGQLSWDWQHQLSQIEYGLQQAAALAPDLAAITCDTWGVDFGLLDQDHTLLANPCSYRDPRGARGEALLDQQATAPERFQRSGVAQLSFNTLNQLAALVDEEPALARRVAHVAMLPDLLNFHLSGVLRCERSIAATTSCFKAGSVTLDEVFLKQCGINPAWFAPLIAPEPC